jgi:hypothetical protein
MENTKPTDITVEQKLKIRDLQYKLAAIVNQKHALKTEFDALVEKERSLVEDLQKENDSLQGWSEGCGWSLDNDTLEWVQVKPN